MSPFISLSDRIEILIQSYSARILWLPVLFCFFLTGEVAKSQTVVTAVIGPTSGTGAATYGPIWTGSSGSLNKYSRYAYIYTASELGVLGIPSGSKIVKLAWLRATGGTIATPNTFNVWMKNTTETSLTNLTTWGALVNGTTQTYSNSNYSILNGTNTYMDAQFNIPGNDTFTYTGGGLQILTDWTRVGTQTGTAINFYRVAATGKSIGAIGSSALTNTSTLTNGSSLGDFRPTLQITYVTVPACQGVPTTGGVVSLVQGVCSGSSFTMNIANTLSGSGITYQWQSADNAAFTQNVISLGTSASQTTSQTSNKYYRCMTHCSTGSTSDTSAAFLMPMNPAYKCICASGAVSTADEEIFNFTFASLNNSSNCNTLAPGPGSVLQMYSNYQGVAAPSVEKGSTVPFSIQIGTCANAYPNVSAIFIDYNQNGLFTDAGELVYSSAGALTGAHTESGTTVIPTTAVTGYAALRVITSEQGGAITNPCLSYSWGETEDYVINITPTTSCSGAPNPGNTVASAATVCSGSNILLSVQNTVTGTGIQYQWYNSAGIITGAISYSYTTPNLFAPETYYCAVTCMNSSMTTNSTPITIGMTSFIDCYCSSVAGSDADDEIFSVMFNGITNVSDCNVAAPGPGSVLNRYSNFHPIGALTTVELEATVPFSIQVDDCDLAPYYSFATAIWIDFNHNGSFADAGEKVFIESTAVDGPRYVIGNVTIPCTALTGPTGMRITEAEGLSGALITPCLTYSFGETEDYIINIVPRSSGIDYSFGGTGAPTANATAGVPVSHLTVSGIAQGNNANTLQTSLLISSNNPSTYSGASAQMNAGITARNRSLQLTDTSAYYQVTLTPVSGYNVTLDSVKLGSFSNSTGPTRLDIRTSLDNYATSIGTVNVIANSTWAYVAPVITGMTSSVPTTIRIYGYVNGGSGSVTTGTTAANWFVDDIRLKVSVKCNTACNLTATISNTSIACNGGSSNITVNASNGTGLINYQLNGGIPQTSNVFTNLSAGSYTVTLTDGNACTASATKIISQPAVATSSTSVTACNSYTWPANIQTYTVTGVFTSIGTTTAGCARYDTLNLTINYGTSSTPQSATACGSYVWNGTTYTNSGTYTYTTLNANGCNNTSTLNLTINPTTTIGSTTVSTCNSYAWNGVTYTASGVYTFTSLNASGCVNTATLNLTINQSSTNGNATTTACNSYVWNAVTYTSTGVYTFTSLNAFGCVNTSTLNLTINQSSTNGNATTTACNSYTWNGVTYTVSGVYTFTSLNASGCVNTATLNLTINQSSTNGNATATACNTYTWNSVTYTASGVYTFTSLNASGCVNTATLNLTINQSSTNGNATTTACNSYTWNSVTYTASGVYSFTSLNAFGCVNTASLTLTINQNTTNGSTTATACNSYIWNGVTYTASGTYTFTSLNSSGCVNTATLTLTIKQSSTNGNATTTACNTYTWNGVTYTSTGVYTSTSLNAGGCVNTATLTLTINQSSTNGNATATACNSYLWNSVTYTASGIYTFTSLNASGCVNTATLNLTVNHSSSNGNASTTSCNSYSWNGVTYTASGIYTFTSLNASGCVNTASLTLTINQSTSNGNLVTSACDSYAWNGVTYTNTGTYTFTSLNTAGCLNTATLNLSIHANTSSSNNVTACDSYAWNQNNVTYSISGSYLSVGINAQGCTDTHTLNLTINQSTSSSVSATSCDTYTWTANGQVYTTSGSYTKTSLNAAGCIHTLSLFLTITSSVSHTTTIEACDFYTWANNNVTYTLSGVYSAVTGCHSEILNLTLTPSSSHTTSATACDSYIWPVNNITYTNSGLYTQVTGCHTEVLQLTLTPSTSDMNTVAACDSYAWTVNNQTYTVTGNYIFSNACHTSHLNLTVTPSSSSSISASACDSYTWSLNNVTYTASGTYSYVVGCHTATLNVSITPGSVSAETATSCDSYTWSLNSVSYTASGIYTNVSGCHTTLLNLSLTTSSSSSVNSTVCDSYVWPMNGVTYTTSGIYTFVSGCQTKTLNLTITPSTSSSEIVSACDSYTWSANGMTYTTTGSYSFVSGCHTITLNLFITASNTSTEIISACDSYTWSANGVTYTTTGSYSFVSGCHTTVLNLSITPSSNSIETVTACDSYTWPLSGTNYTASGVYSSVVSCHTATLNLSLTSSSTSTETILACDNYTWPLNGITYSTSGSYSVSTACHSTVLNLNIVSSTNSSNTVSACDQYTWPQNGMTYTASGNYSFVSGCHTSMLQLFITPSTSSVIIASACDSYFWQLNGLTYSASGSYTYVANCHTTTLNLSIASSSSVTYNITTCDSYTWPINGTTYSISGMYTAVNNCHSDLLNLVINQSTSNGSLTATACDSYVWNGMTYTASGNYTFTSLNQGGCLNTAGLTLLVNQSSSTSATITACDTYTWAQNGITYSVTGTYTSVQTNAFGCSNYHTLNLFINQSTSAAVNQSACDSYLWPLNSSTYTQSGTYTSTELNASGCMHIDMLILSITTSSTATTVASACDSYDWLASTMTYTASGMYQVINGCHTDLLNLSITPSTSNSTTVSACDAYHWPVNNTSYSLSGVYAFVSECHTETLILNITPSSTSQISMTACDSYTWPLNNITYTQSGVYSVVTSCHTTLLSLTILPSSETTNAVTACDSYTWSVNGQAYVSSGIYTAVNSCHTSVLNLIVHHSSIDSSSVVSLGSYIWLVNGLTYSTSGMYSHSSLNEVGCVHTEILDLTIAGTSCQFTLNVAEDQPISCYGDNNASLQASVTPTGSYTYTIVSPLHPSYSNTTGFFMQLEAGTHTVIASNGTCADYQTITFMNPDPLDIEFTTDSVVSCLGNDGQISVFITGGTNNLQPYLTWWTNSAGDTINDILNDNFAVTLSNLPADNYTVKVEDDYGCFYSKTSMIGVADIIQVNASFSPILCHGGVTQVIPSSTGGVPYSPLTYLINGIPITSSYSAGTYTVVAMDDKGCTGSKVITINEPSAISVNTYETGCGPYLWNGNVYSQAGSYSATFISANGCDSVHTIILTIQQNSTSTVSASACDSYLWNVNGEVYTISGLYTSTTQNSVGCIQTATLNLSITPSSTSSLTASSCNSYTWLLNGVTYTSSGIYTDVSGCQTTTLNIMIQSTTSSSTSVSACSSYTWPLTGINYTASGIYSTMLLSSTGCDSLVSIVLTINNCSSILNLKAYLQGYYLGNSSMQSVLYNQGQTSDLTLVDTVDVRLYEQTFPYAVIATERVLLHTDGTATCIFPPLTGSYYVSIQNRNTLLTWSSNPVTLGSIPVTYDFSAASSMAYGDNMIAMEPGVWALYMADINVDENIDLFDMGLMEDDITNFLYGYLATDINGDGNVDLLDTQVISDNISSFIYSIHP